MTPSVSTYRPLLLAGLLAATVGLAACGKTGDLERPAPLFGAQAKADYDAKQAADANAKAEAATRRRSQGGNTVFDPVDRPPTQAPYAPPIPGRTDPLGPAPGADTAPDR